MSAFFNYKIKTIYFDSDSISTCMCGNPKVWKSSCAIKPMELETYMKGDLASYDNIYHMMENKTGTSCVSKKGKVDKRANKKKSTK